MQLQPQSPKDSKESFLKALHYHIQSQKDFMSFEMLGRSLAYNPYPPRFSVDFKNLESKVTHFIKAFDFENLESIIKLQSDIIILDMARDSSAKACGEGLECIGYLRHYTKALILLKDVFIDPYQILQAVVYGADGVILSLDSMMQKENIELSYKLGLQSFVEVSTQAQITKAIFNKAQGFFIQSEFFSQLVGIIPKRKLIITQESAMIDSNLANIVFSFA